MSEISQTDLLESSNLSLQKKIHTALPAKVLSFNAASQTVSAELMIEQVDGEGNQLAMPPLVDVPVMMFSYGEFYIVSAPSAGDEGLVVFSERCIDGWHTTGNKTVPLDMRFHDLSDGFFIGGFKSAGKALPVQSGSIYVGNGSTGMRISKGNIQLNGNVTITGKINVSGQGVIDGVNVSKHVHGGVQGGNAKTGVAE